MHKSSKVLSTRSTRIPRYVYNGSNYPNHRPIDGIASTDGRPIHEIPL